ncbi:hypothetical protein PSPO01_15036 [Paraphaeosphaeria sporulosa]
MTRNPNMSAHASKNFSRSHRRPQPTYSLFPQERASKRDAQFRADMMALQVKQTVNLRATLPQPPPVEPKYLGPKKLQKRTVEKEEASCCIVM